MRVRSLSPPFTRTLTTLSFPHHTSMCTRRHIALVSLNSPELTLLVSPFEPHSLADFTRYILENKYQDEINKINPLGMKGQLIEAYAALTKSLWSGRDSVFSPKLFKSIIGKLNPIFVGYNQVQLGFLL